MGWVFGLCDLAGTRIGRIHWPTERRLSLALNGQETASVTLRLDDPLVTEIWSRKGDVMLEVYDESATLCFQGELTSGEKDGQGDGNEAAVCNFAGPLLMRLGKRMVLDSTQPDGYARIDWSAETIISELITSTNFRRDTGIRLGTIDTLYNTSIGSDAPLRLKPVAETLTDLQNAKIPYPLITPLDYVAADNLDSVSGPPGVVDGRTDLEGNTWDSNGSWNDWTAGTVGQGAGRAGWGVTPPDSRWAISSLAARALPLVAGMDFWSSIRARNGQPLYFYMYVRLSGHTAATPETGNWLRVLCGFDTTSGYYQLQKKVGATITTLGTYSVDAGVGYYWDGGTSTTWYSIRLLVDEFGNYTVWNYKSDLAATLGIGFPGISGQDDDLVTGGPLATGKYAFGDIFGNGPPSGVDVGRGFRNVFLSDYTGPQSFDFEFVPSEPTADTGQSGVVGAGVKLWTFNVSTPQIGTTTNAVFEYGPTAKGFNDKIDREGLMTLGYAPPADASGTDIKTSIADDATLAARGLYEDVIPSDVSDGQLRQALVDLNVQVRKQARELVTFEPTRNSPVYGTDWSVGDYVIGRCKVSGVEHFDGLFRVYGVDIDIDDEGNATVKPVLVPQ